MCAELTGRAEPRVPAPSSPTSHCHEVASTRRCPVDHVREGVESRRAFVIGNTATDALEAPGVGPPVLVPPESSEWLEGVEAGSLILVGSDTERIHSVALRLLADAPAREAMTAGRNPFGDGHAAPRVGQALEHLIFKTAPDPYRVAFGRERVLEASGFDPEEIAPTSSKIAAAHPEVVSGSTVTARFAALRRQGAAGGGGFRGQGECWVRPPGLSRRTRSPGSCVRVLDRVRVARANARLPVETRLLRRWGVTRRDCCGVGDLP